MKRPRVLIADDHPILLQGVRTLIAPEFQVVAAVEDGRQVLKVIGKLLPDLVVMDISMPNFNGIEATRALRSRFPGIKIVILTMHEDPMFAAEALEAGASGYVLKGSACSDLLQALRTVLGGRRFVSRGLSSSVLPVFGKAHPVLPQVASLSPRQREVLQLLAEGGSLKEIASRLNISKKTVEFHKYRLCKMLGLHTTAELTAFAIRHGIVSA